MNYTKILQHYSLILVFAALMIAGGLTLLTTRYADAAVKSDPVTAGGDGGSSQIVLDAPSSTKNFCGGTKDRVYTSIDIGCSGKGYALTDMAFAVIRFLSAGVGLVVVGSIVFGGVQYTMSRGDPQATAAAVNRIRNSLFALLIFIFAYAILDYLLPKGFLK